MPSGFGCSSFTPSSVWWKDVDSWCPDPGAVVVGACGGSAAADRVGDVCSTMSDEARARQTCK
jgi:hypothetical protein